MKSTKWLRHLSVTASKCMSVTNCIFLSFFCFVFCLHSSFREASFFKAPVRLRLRSRGATTSAFSWQNKSQTKLEKKRYRSAEFFGCICLLLVVNYLYNICISYELLIKIIKNDIKLNKDICFRIPIFHPKHL